MISALVIATQLFIGGLVMQGKHVETNGASEVLGVAQAPIFAVRQHLGRVDLNVESVPVGTLTFPAGSMPKSLAYGYDDAELRVWDPGRRFALAIGESLYFQRNEYAFSSQAVRSAGTRYGIYGALPLRSGGSVTLGAAVSPSMHGRLSMWSPPGSPFLARSFYGTDSLVDATAQLERPLGRRHEFVIGLRYFNDEGGTPDPAFFRSSHTAGAAVGLFAGYGFRI